MLDYYISEDLDYHRVDKIEKDLLRVDLMSNLSFIFLDLASVESIPEYSLAWFLDSYGFSQIDQFPKTQTAPGVDISKLKLIQTLPHEELLVVEYLDHFKVYCTSYNH